MFKIDSTIKKIKFLVDKSKDSKKYIKLAFG